MAVVMRSIAILCFIGSCLCNSTDGEHLTTEPTCAGQIADLRETVELNGAIIKEQHAVISRLIRDLDYVMDVNKQQSGELKRQAKLVKSLESKIQLLGSSHQSRLHRAANNFDPEISVAFTAVLDHDIDNIGPNETIVFNKPILNIGNHYNHYTGAFTAPTNGVYSFAFFIGCRGSTQIYADLYVNDHAVASATAEGTHATHDTQGGNVANFMLTAGDVVRVKHHIWGNHIEAGNVGTIVTTFSGHFLFAIESPSISIIG